jgi:dTDP-4-amino-4,6-dideoxygalactose transaminase
MTLQTRIPILDLHPQVEALLPELLEAIEQVLRSTHYINGPSVQAFEQETAGLLGVKHAVGLNSGTDALVIALRALGIGPGDEVITSPFTFFATAEAISNVGARPVFVDVDPVTMNLDPDLLEAAITERTRAIIPVHLFGQPCDMAAIMGIANRWQLNVVEDCAQSFGARFMVGSSKGGGADYAALRRELSGLHTGSIGTIGAFSFFPSKNLGAVGDGGLLTTNDDAIADSARMLRAHGGKAKYRNEILGYNSRLDELQAAILLVKLPYLLGWNFGRRCVAEEYHRVLAGHDQIRVPSVVQGHVFHQYTIQVPAGQRDRIQARLAEAGIDTLIYYPIPCHQLPVYQTSHAGVHCPNAEALAGQVLSLPIWPEMSEELVSMVAETVLSCLEPR